MNPLRMMLVSGGVLTPGDPTIDRTIPQRLPVRIGLPLDWRARRAVETGTSLTAHQFLMTAGELQKHHRSMKAKQSMAAAWRRAA
jgi:hypothetical protein